jgi:hypothetical protein
MPRTTRLARVYRTWRAIHPLHLSADCRSDPRNEAQKGRVRTARVSLLVMLFGILDKTLLCKFALPFQNGHLNLA